MMKQLALIGVFVVSFVFVVSAIWIRTEEDKQLKIKQQKQQEQNINQANKKLFEQTTSEAQAGDSEAQYELSVMYKLGHGVAKDDTKAEEWCRKSADAGYAEAYVAFGYNYYTGNDGATTPDYAKAAEWFKKAADAGHAQAQHQMGIMHLFGEGVPKDETRAFEWFTKAAKAGYISSRQQLVIMYKSGIGVEKDERQAALWCNSIGKK